MESLVDDIFAIVVQFLPTVEILQLLATGSKRIMRIIAANIDTVILEDSCDKKLQQLASLLVHMPKLRNVTLGTTTRAILPVKFISATAGEKVERLKLVGCNLEGIWSGAAASNKNLGGTESVASTNTNLASCYPNLKSLHLRGGPKRKFYGALLSRLPKSLTELDVADSAYYAVDLTSNWPPSLTSLTFGRHCDFSDFYKIFGRLPPTLLSLTCKTAAYSTYGWSLSSELKELPSGLQTLILNTHYLRTSQFYALPHSLKTLRVVSIIIDTDATSTVPKTTLLPYLTHFEFDSLRDNTGTDLSPVLAQLSSLRSLMIGKFCEHPPTSHDIFFPEPKVDTIAASVVDLRLCFDAFYPPLGASKLSQLPQNLQKLTIDSAVDVLAKDLRVLPQTLTYLELRQNSFTNAFLRFLPAGLLHLSLPTNAKLTDACFTSLPPLLQTFKSYSNFTSDIVDLAHKNLLVVITATLALKGSLTEAEIVKRRPYIQASFYKD